MELKVGSDLYNLLHGDNGKAYVHIPRHRTTESSPSSVGIFLTMEEVSKYDVIQTAINSVFHAYVPFGVELKCSIDYFTKQSELDEAIAVRQALSPQVKEESSDLKTKF